MRAILRQHNIEVVDALVKQHVLVVVGEQAEVDTADHDAVEYTEQSRQKAAIKRKHVSIKTSLR